MWHVNTKLYKVYTRRSTTINTTQHNAEHNTTQHNAAQRSITHNTTQHRVHATLVSLLLFAFADGDEILELAPVHACKGHCRVQQGDGGSLLGTGRVCRHEQVFRAGVGVLRVGLMGPDLGFLLKMGFAPGRERTSLRHLW